MNKNLELKTGFAGGNARNVACAALLLLSLLILLYANSFEGVWIHDDYDNIVNNKHIKVDDLSWRSIEQTLYGITPRDTWSRPLAYLSFAVNYRIGGLDVFGYHLVNFAIHYLAALVLFLFVYETLKLPLLAGRYGSCAYSIALLSAVLWAVHPIQVTAVTYIVQRMAGMTALFYVLAMYLYLKGRTAQSGRDSVVCYGFCAIAFLLSLGSKQNAAMLPVSLVLYDLFLIQGVSRAGMIRTAKKIILPAAVAAVLLALHLSRDPSVADYDQRIFGMGERLLTQPRVFFHYVSLLLYPDDSRLMMLHDVEISRSLFDPWTTFAAIAGIAGWMTFAVAAAKRLPLVSYCVLFFFLNHLIEGSFISLEMIYEHRNYLPSMLIFVPVAIGALRIMDFFIERRIAVGAAVAVMAGVIVFLGVNVIEQNSLYRDEETFWRDNVRKAPALHLPHQNLGNVYQRSGRLPEAFSELEKALGAKLSGNVPSQYKTYMALVYYYILVKDHGRAGYYLEKVLDHAPRRADFINIKGVMLFEKNEIAQAEAALRKAVSIDPAEPTYRVNLGIVFLRTARYGEAIREAQKALMLDPDSWKAYFLIADTHRARGNQRLADHFASVGRRVGSEQASGKAREDALFKWDLVRNSAHP